MRKLAAIIADMSRLFEAALAQKLAALTAEYDRSSVMTEIEDWTFDFEAARPAYGPGGTVEFWIVGDDLPDGFEWVEE